MAKKAPPGKEVLRQRRLAAAKKQKADAAAAKLAALTPNTRALHDAREEIRKYTRMQRSERSHRDRKALRDEYARVLDERRKNSEEQRKLEREEAIHRAANALAEIQPNAEQATPKRPSRVSFAAEAPQTPSTEGEGETRLTTAPTLKQLSTLPRFACQQAQLPTIEGLAAMSCVSVVCADATVGIGSWGEGAGTWARPGRWIPLVEKLNRAYNALPGGGDDRHTLGMKVRNGEYNVVFFPDQATDLELELPPLVDGTGRVLRNDEVVIRMTRPDAAVQHSGDPFFRYKRLEAMKREFYYTMHGAVNGFAPACLAATLYPAIRITQDDGTQHDLYGALYVMRKADQDLNGLLDEQTALLREKCVGREAQTEALRKAGRKAALWLLPVLCRQAKLGALSFDAKPANYVATSDAVAYAIDFDASMYTVTAETRTEWPAALLLLLALLTAHVRLYSTPALADGWAQALRPLILELCGPARCARWMFDAQLCKRAFREVDGEDDHSSRLRLEMMTHTYFVKTAHVAGAAFRSKTGPNAPKLIEQLLRFCLHGTTERQDNELASALGCPRAHAALAARDKPWG